MREFPKYAVLVIAIAQCSADPQQLAENSVHEKHKVIAEQNISIQIGHETLAPKEYDREKVLAMVKRHNKSVRLPNLPDRLNAEALDAERVEAFIDGLSRLDAKELSLVAGRTVRLNLPSLQLQPYSAIPVPELRSGFHITALAENPNPHLAGIELVAPFSRKVAQDTIEEARRVVEERDRQMKTLAGQGGGDSRQAVSARQARQSAAMVWLSLATQLATGHGAETQAAGLVKEAQQALSRESVAPSSGGMPP